MVALGNIKRSRLLCHIAVFLLSALITQNLALAQCGPHWVSDAGQVGVDDQVFGVASFDDGLGGGPALYVSGYFLNAGGAPANRIAKWTGSSWSPLGVGFNEGAFVMTVYDDGQGGGPALYAGGNFTMAGGQFAGRVARWNGTAWSPVGAGMNGTVGCFCAFDDGQGGGTALYVGGQFSSVIGVPGTSRIAKWNGSTWSGVGGGADAEVTSMAVFDDGNGPALFVGGYFSMVGGQPIAHIAKWNGIQWSPYGVLGPTPPEHVHALQVYDSGSGPRLYAGGHFVNADGHPALRIAQWDGSAWQPVGNNDTNGEILTMTVFDDRTGGRPSLYVGGFFTTIGGVVSNYVARWNGANWSALSGGVNDAVWSLAVHENGSGRGPALYVGGYFTSAGGLPAFRVGHWEGSGAPTITQQPMGQTVFVGQTVTLSADAIGAIPLSYQWRKDTLPLSDDGRITGATTATLTIDPTQAGDGGNYDVVVTSTGCGAQISAPAAIGIIVQGCPGDVNVDGYVNGADISGFVNCVLTGAGCEHTDIDGDSQTADVDSVDDVAAFSARLIAVNPACL